MLFEPIYIPRALYTGTCIRRVTYFILRTYIEHALATANTGNTREKFWGKMQMNGPEG